MHETIKEANIREGYGVVVFFFPSRIKPEFN